MLLVPVLTLASAAATEAATLRVNTTKDEIGGSKCSLREAIDTVNSPRTRTSCGTADTFSNLIVLGAKTYQLSIPPTAMDTDQNCIAPTGTVPDQNASGDLCVTSNASLTIAGRGSATIIKGEHPLADRLMTIAPQASVSLVQLTLEGGHAPDGATNTLPICPTSDNGANGGAIYNTGRLFTMAVTFQGDSAGVGGVGDATAGGGGCAGGSGGGIYNDGTSASLPVQNTMFIGDAAGAGGAGGSPSTSVPGGSGGSGGSGGGIDNNGGTLQVSNTSFALNKAGSGGQGGGSDGGNGGTGGDGSPGGGIYSTGGSMSVINGTFAGNQAGSGAMGGNDTGGGNGGSGGAGANGGALAVNNSPSGLRNATVSSNIVGLGGAGGTGNTAGNKGANGVAGGIFVQASKTADNLTLENTIVASSVGLNCSLSSAIIDGGHNLNFPASDTSCPAAVHGNPKLKAFADYGGYTGTLALAPGSAAINQVPRKGAGCPATDQRTVRRPQGPACDIGAFEFARPKLEIDTPRNDARYNRGSRVLAFFICREGTAPPRPAQSRAASAPSPTESASTRRLSAGRASRSQPRTRKATRPPRPSTTRSSARHLTGKREDSHWLGGSLPFQPPSPRCGD